MIVADLYAGMERRCYALLQNAGDAFFLAKCHVLQLWPLHPANGGFLSGAAFGIKLPHERNLRSRRTGNP
jgi:hypothetical protein